MTYAAQEVSVESGAPVLLFKFEQGSSTWYLTNAAEAVTVNSQLWTPAVVVVGRIGQASDSPKDVLTLKLPASDSLAATFLGYMPDAVTWVTVWRWHVGSSDWIVYWTGRVSRPVASSASVVTLECETDFAALGRLGLRHVYSRTCQHVLFDNGCKLSAAANAVSVSITSVTGPVIGIATGTFPDFTGGTLKAPDGTIGSIVYHEGVVMRLRRPIKSLLTLALPAVATAYTGCDKSPVACGARGNLGNFGGFPTIPILNPWGGNANVF